MSRPRLTFLRGSKATSYRTDPVVEVMLNEMSKDMKRSRSYIVNGLIELYYNSVYGSDISKEFPLTVGNYTGGTIIVRTDKPEQEKRKKALYRALQQLL